jgi:hypothetical protein
MTKYADDATTELARKLVEEDKKVADHSRAEYARLSKGRPTPTQQENDMAMHGAHILEHEDDGSGPDPYNGPIQNRHLVEGGTSNPARPQTYKTKAAHES